MESNAPDCNCFKQEDLAIPDSRRQCDQIRMSELWAKLRFERTQAIEIGRLSLLVAMSASVVGSGDIEKLKSDKEPSQTRQSVRGRLVVDRDC